MLRRRAIVPALAVLAALALAACTPGGGEATPTPTELTQEQAYAAAEAAFRAYIDALNQIDVADPSTFEPAFGLSTGQLNAFDRKQYSQWHADQWNQSGDAIVESISDSKISDDGSNVQLAICLNVSDVALVDASGVSHVSPQRPPIQPLYATILRSNSEWLVSNLFGRADGTPC